MSKIVSLNDWLDESPQHSAAHPQLFLTEEEVRSFPQFKEASSEEVQHIITTLHDLALVSYDLFCQKSMKNVECYRAA